MHAAGFHHEHQRFDRDEHIELFRDKMVEMSDAEYRTNLAVKASPWEMPLTPYDVNSLMHYNAWAYSKGEAPTIKFKNRERNPEHTRYFSRADLAALRALYPYTGSVHNPGLYPGFKSVLYREHPIYPRIYMTLGTELGTDEMLSAYWRDDTTRAWTYRVIQRYVGDIDDHREVSYAVSASNVPYIFWTTNTDNFYSRGMITQYYQLDNGRFARYPTVHTGDGRKSNVRVVLNSENRFELFYDVSNARDNTIHGLYRIVNPPINNDPLNEVR